MATKIEIFNQSQLRKDIPNIRPGDRIKVYQKIKEEKKERVQVFEGLVIARKHGKGISSTITVRRVLQGVGVEKNFPIHSPTIEKIEILKRSKVRRAKLYYLRKKAEKKTRRKLKAIIEKPSPEEIKTQEKEEIEEKSEPKKESEQEKK